MALINIGLDNLSLTKKRPNLFGNVKHKYEKNRVNVRFPKTETKQELNKSVSVNEVREEQADPTPMMKNIVVIPHEGGQPFEFVAIPDTGATKTIIARNLAIRKGMRFNPDSNLKITGVNAQQRLDNSGSVMFTLRYQGRSTEVSALVSDAIKDEILLSWRVLKNLGVIDSTFPNVRHTPVRAAKTMIGLLFRNLAMNETTSTDLAAMIEKSGFGEIESLEMFKLAGEKIARIVFANKKLDLENIKDAFNGIIWENQPIFVDLIEIEGFFRISTSSTNDKKASKEELDKEIDLYQEVTNQKKTRQRITYP